MNRLLYTLLLVFAAGLLHAQLNTTLQSNLQYQVRLNDIWGWVAPDSTEYALVGLLNGVSIVSLADPTDPKEVAFVPGGNSVWRDLKTWGNHAYVTTDQSGTRDGLLIIDLSQLPDTVTFTKWTPTIDERTLYTCHNLYIEAGIAYLAGCNVNSGGILFADIQSDPKNPVLIGRGPNIYAHDVYTRNDTMYTSEIYRGEIGFYDISNKTNPISLAKQLTPFRFTHNTWLSDNSRVIYSTDEQGNAPIGAYDIADLDNIIELDQFRPAKTLGAGVIPHNVHVKDDYLMISYYTDGGVIVDAARPDNLIEVANYDTYPGANGGFSGAWGLYPFLPSGNILISDINTGLWVVKPDLKRACYLEGMVRDSASGQALSDVQVRILSDQTNEEKTNLQGIFKTGQAAAGTFIVRFTKENYYPKEVQVNLENGVVTNLEVKLVPIARYAVAGKVLSQGGNVGIADAQILVMNDSNFYTKTSDVNGNFNLNEIIPGNYDIYIGAWGYRYKMEADIIIDSDKTITLTLAPGYEDNFLLDLGWEAFAENASGGRWERAVPVGTTFQGRWANPDEDLDDDLGDFCYVTGNHRGSASTDDVDGGPVTLVSPPIDLSSYQNPVLTYRVWFFNANGEGISPTNDSLVVRVTNGQDTVTVEKITTSQSEWRMASRIQLSDFIGVIDSIKVLFETSDIGNESHTVEAALDGFAIEEGNSTPVQDIDLQVFILKAYPNPFQNQLTVSLESVGNNFKGTLRLLNAVGQIVKNMVVNNDSTISIEASFPAGIYWLQAIGADGKSSETIKVVKF